MQNVFIWESMLDIQDVTDIFYHYIQYFLLQFGATVKSKNFKVFTLLLELKILLNCKDEKSC